MFRSFSSVVMLPSGRLRTLRFNQFPFHHSSSISFCSCSTARRFAYTSQQSFFSHMKKRLDSAIPDGCCLCALQLVHFLVADNLELKEDAKLYSTLVEELDELMTHELCPLLAHNRTHHRSTTNDYSSRP